MLPEELRERNKRQTVERALELFIRQGVEQTTIREIAAAAGLTERSVYRYFESKAALVLATTFLFWERTARQVEEIVTAQLYPGMPGIEQIRIMLAFYSGMYLEHPEYVRYILQAETALYNAGLTAELQERPPGRFDRADTPLTRAIQAGLADGSVSSAVDTEVIYYNLYDAILGTMQRQVLGSTRCTLDKRQRMEHLCGLFLKALQGLV